MAGPWDARVEGDRDLDSAKSGTPRALAAWLQVQQTNMILDGGSRRLYYYTLLRVESVFPSLRCLAAIDP